MKTSAMPRKLKIVVTGNMGSGKTTICKVFETLGIPVFYADTRAKSILFSPGVSEKVIRTFGQKITSSDGTIAKHKLAEEVFSNPDKLKMLNQIIHPLVYEHFEAWFKHQNAPYCIMESAIVMESGNTDYFDKVILVWAPEQELINRVQKRDGLSVGKVNERMQNQWSQEKKIPLAHFVIRNDNLQLVIPQVTKLDKKLQSLSSPN